MKRNDKQRLLEVMSRLDKTFKPINEEFYGENRKGCFSDKIKIGTDQEVKLDEYDNYNYPAGADNDPRAPWNQSKDDEEDEYEPEYEHPDDIDEAIDEYCRNMDEGWGKNLAAGALMTAATLGGMSNADAGNRNKPQTQMVEPTKLDSMINAKSDSINFKAYGVGESPDLSTANQIAINNAKTKIAQEMGVGTQTLKNINIETEKAFKTSNGGYIYHVVVTMPKANNMNEVDQQGGDEQAIIADILSVNEGMGDIVSKVVEYGKKGLLTAAIVLAVALSSQAQQQNKTNDIIGVSHKYIDNNEQQLVYSFMVGISSELASKFMKSGQDIENSGVLIEISIYYEALRDGKQPQQLSKLAASNALTLMKHFQNADKETINKYIEIGRNLHHNTAIYENKNSKSKQKLFEVMGRLDKTFKPKLNEGWNLPDDVSSNDPYFNQPDDDWYDYWEIRLTGRNRIPELYLVTNEGRFSHLDWEHVFPDYDEFESIESQLPNIDNNPESELYKRIDTTVEEYVNSRKSYEIDWETPEQDYDG